MCQKMSPITLPAEGEDEEGGRAGEAGAASYHKYNNRVRSCLGGVEACGNGDAERF